MTSNPLFSVVIPAYNAGSSISSLINKFIKQDYARMEIIVVDDGSQDDTYTICQVLEFSNKILGFSQYFIFHLRVSVYFLPFL